MTGFNSPAMELEAFSDALTDVTSDGLEIGAVCTDRHSSIARYLREKWPQIVHQYDVFVRCIIYL